MMSASLSGARGSACCVLAVLLVTGLMPAGPPVLVAQEATLVVAGRLLDPASGIVTRDQKILVERGRIVAVGPVVPQPAGARVVDLSRYLVLPGLIDAHVHLVIGGSVRENALADLRAGFTTVVDLGARGYAVLEYRDSINAGLAPGPRVLAAGVWVGTQGGVCEFNGIGIGGGPPAFAERVRENVKAGADVIKVCASGWPAEGFAEPDSVEISQAALTATVREAHGATRLVVAHAISAGSVRAALAAGVDGLAHAAYLDSATATAMREREVFLITTLASLTSGDKTAAGQSLVRAISFANQVGVLLVLGTDGGVLPHGRNAAEFLALQSAGISALDAIRTATTSAARALRLTDSIGAIRPGMSADLIAVEGDPLAELEALSRIRFVMLRGRQVAMPSRDDATGR